MSTPEYRALKNYLHNTAGVISRDDVKAVIKEIVTQVAREELQRFLKTNEASKIIQKSLTWELWNCRQYIAEEVLNSLLKSYKKE
jgi:hypothetical protein